MHVVVQTKQVARNEITLIIFDGDFILISFETYLPTSDRSVENPR